MTTTALTKTDDKENNKDKRITGRPTKLTPALQSTICEFIAAGNYLITACQAVGISKSTYLGWLERGELESREGGGLYLDFLLAIKKAEGQAEAEMLRVARSAAIDKKDGYLAITVNERRHPDRWGKRDRATVNIEEVKTINITQVTVVKDYGEGKDKA